MSARTKPPFRADHVGSLLRPPRLHEARADYEAGRIDAEQLRAVEDDAIRDIVRKQEDVGLRSATDGEFRRATWHMDFIYQLDGITKEAGHLAVKFHNERGDIEWTPAALHVDGKLGVSKTIFGDHFEFVRGTVTKTVPKLTIPSPSMVHYRGGKAAIDESVYPELDQFWADLTAAYREEVRRLGELGCTYLQLDDTSLAYMNDPHQREYVASIGGDPERQHVEYIRHINESLAERPAGMTVTTHMCRGNFRSSWAAEGGYDFVAEALLNDLQVDGFFMEWDDERSGGFEPLRFLPKGEKQVVLGLVTTKRGELESRDVLLRRIEEASRYAPLEQLCVSPQCGFSSTVEGNELTEEEQWAKLRLIVEVAEEVWGRAPTAPEPSPV
jgi:methionine synthase II (cobalamin-independent)